jgi:predicted transcriptional regulator
VFRVELVESLDRANVILAAAPSSKRKLGEIRHFAAETVAEAPAPACALAALGDEICGAANKRKGRFTTETGRRREEQQEKLFRGWGRYSTRWHSLTLDKTTSTLSLPGLWPRSADIPGMAMNPSPRRDASAPDPVSESEAARAERLARERRQIDEAIASAAAGEVVSEEDFDAWVDSLGTDHELPPPRPR